MTNFDATIDTYLSAWNEEDVTRRAKLIDQAWTDDGQLVDPPMAGTGPAEISAIADALHGQFPQHSFRRSTAIDAHHQYLRFGWELVGPDGAVALAGLDVAELAADGRLRRVTGFFGPLTPITAS